MSQARRQFGLEPTVTAGTLPGGPLWTARRRLARDPRPESRLPRNARRLHATPMSRRAALLAAYDQQLRTEAETPGAVHITRLGPLRVATYPGGRGSSPTEVSKTLILAPWWRGSSTTAEPTPSSPRSNGRPAGMTTLRDSSKR